MAYALIQDATFAGVSNINIQTGEIQKRNNVRDTTNSASGTAAEFTGGRYHYAADVMGHLNTGSAYPLPIGVTLSNGPISRITRITIVKEQNLKPVTGPSVINGQREFTKGVVRYSGRGFGALGDTEKPVGNGTTTLTSFQVPIAGSYNLSANAVITTDTINYEFDQGGNVVYPFNFLFTSTVTINGSDNPFSLTEFRLDATLDNGNYCDGVVYVERMQATMDYEAGVAVPIQVRGPFHGNPHIDDVEGSSSS